jgi:ATP-binding cassette subfamily F protein uup
MDKIVDHLFVFRGDGEIEDFPGNYSDFRAYEDSADVALKEENVSTEKKDWKQNNPTGNLTLTNKKNFKKLNAKSRIWNTIKSKSNNLFADGKVVDDAIEKKANELHVIISKIRRKRRTLV